MQQFVNSARGRTIMNLFFRHCPQPFAVRHKPIGAVNELALIARPQPLHRSLNSTNHLSSDPLASCQAQATACSHRFFEMLDDGPALLIAANDANVGICEEWLNEAMIGAVRCRSFDAAPKATRRGALRVSLFIVDLDSLGGISVAFDDIIALRDANPCIPMILLSAKVQASDYSTERLRLCDVTLRAPVGHASLELAIVEAARNNLIWCGREDARS